MKKIFGLSLLVFCFGLSLVPSTHAYELVDTQAVAVTDAARIYTVTYEFGFLNADLLMPTVPSSPYTKERKPKVSYSLVGEGDSSTVRTAAVVLSSDAALRDGYYYVPRGERAQFTLLVVVASADNQVLAPQAMQIDRLVGVARTGDDVKLIEVSSADLSAYQTDRI